MLGRFLGSTAVYTIANIVNAAVPFALLPVLTRLLSPEDYGTVAMFATTVSVLSAFTGLSVHGAISVRYFEQESFHLPSVVRTGLALVTGATLVSVALVALGRSWLGEFTHLPVTWLVAATVLSGAQFLMQIQLALWQAEHKPIRYGALRIGQSCLDVALSLALVLFVSRTWQGRSAGQWAAGIAFACLTLFLLSRGGWLRGRVRADYLRNLLHFGVPLIPHTLGGLAIALVDRYLVSNILGIGNTGIYMAGLQLGMAMGLMSDAFVKAFGPWLNRQLKIDDEASRHRVVGAVYASFLALPAIGCAIYGVMWLAFDFVLPDSYREARTVLPFFIAGNTFLGMYYAIAGLIFFSSQTYRISKITGLIGLVSIPMTWMLITKFGLIGASLSYAASQLLVFLLAWRESTALFTLPWRQVRLSIRTLAGGVPT